jgi:hypothetical protein
VRDGGAFGGRDAREGALMGAPIDNARASAL